MVGRINVVSFVSEVSGRRETEHKSTNSSGRVCGVRTTNATMTGKNGKKGSR